MQHSKSPKHSPGNSSVCRFCCSSPRQKLERRAAAEQPLEPVSIVAEQTPSAQAIDAHSNARKIQAVWRKKQEKDYPRQLSQLILELDERQEMQICQRMNRVHRLLAGISHVTSDTNSKKHFFVRPYLAATDHEHDKSIDPAPAPESVGSPNPALRISAHSLAGMIDGLSAGKAVGMLDSVSILQTTTATCAAQPMVADVTVPSGGKLTVVGDLHGQLPELLHILAKRGLPSATNFYVINGDMVDRGPHGCEVLLLSCALKLLSPDTVLLHRGNHEDPYCNIFYGFQDECLRKYDMTFFELAQRLFEKLPLCTIVNATIAVLHGGIGPGLSIDRLRALRRAEVVDRPGHPDEDMINAALWSDPCEDSGLSGFSPSRRGRGWHWGENETVKWLNAEGLSLLVRSHECCRRGHKWQHGRKVLTVFSATNYCDAQNDGAYLCLGPAETPNGQTTVRTVQLTALEVATAMSVSSELKIFKHKKLDKNDVVALESQVLRMARESIIENRSALQCFWRAREKEPGLISRAVWATGLRAVGSYALERFATDKQMSALRRRLLKDCAVLSAASAKDNDPHWGLVDYPKFLRRHGSLTLRSGCKAWHDQVLGEIHAAFGTNADSLTEAFAQFDADHSDRISMDEFVAASRFAVPGLNLLSDAQLELLGKSFDSNGDGEISVAEFTARFEAAAGHAHDHDASISKQTDKLEWAYTCDGSIGTTSSIVCTTAQAIDDGRIPLHAYLPVDALGHDLAKMIHCCQAELRHMWRSCMVAGQPVGRGKLAVGAFEQCLLTLNSVTGGAATAKQLQALAISMDADGDGFITESEFVDQIEMLEVLSSTPSKGLALIGDAIVTVPGVSGRL